MGSDLAFHTCPRCGQWHMVGMWCEPNEVQPNPKEGTMPTDEHPEDLANREFYNHLPTRRVRVTYDVDVACNQDVSAGQGDDYVWSLLATDVVMGNLRVRNPYLVEATISDAVRYLDTHGNEVGPQ